MTFDFTKRVQVYFPPPQNGEKIFKDLFFYMYMIFSLPIFPSMLHPTSSSHVFTVSPSEIDGFLFFDYYVMSRSLVMKESWGRRK